MKELLRVMIVLALAFASTALVIKASGVVTEEGVLAFVENARSIHPGYLVAAVVLILLIDLWIAVPTMATILLAGYVLGPLLGGAAAALGLMVLGTTGYAMGRRIGRPLLLRLYKHPAKLQEIEDAFSRNAVLTLFACQALPILPELSCTMAGVSRMPFARFVSAYAVGVVPFAFVVAWAGSKSTLSDPTPAIYTAIGVSVALLLAWRFLSRRGLSKSAVQSQGESL